MKKADIESRMTTLVQLMGDMVEKGCVDETDAKPQQEFIEECWKKFCEVYGDPDFRHSYFTISSSLEKYDPAQRDSLAAYLNSVVNYVEEQEIAESGEAERIKKSVKKLLDHVELECLRINRMEKVQRDADRAERLHDEAVALNNATKESENALAEKVKGFHEQSITILGIFSAVVVGFMSGLSMFTSGFNKLNEVSVYIVAFYSVMVGIILFDILFMLIFFIARISGHSIARDVPPSKNWLRSTVHRYPCVYLFHILAAVVLVALVILQVCFGRSVTNDQIVELVKETCSQIIYN